jgi:adenylate kinase
MPKIALRSVAVMLFGAPGSGKGTVGKHLLNCFDIPHISTGDILREHVAAGNMLGRKVKSFMEAGSLVPDDLVNRIVRERLSQPDCEGGFFLDGYPRTLEQADSFAALLREHRLEPLVIYLNVDYNEIVTRLSARRLCPECGSVYNLVSQPPKHPGVCDEDGVAIVKRDDDSDDVIRQRLEAYDRQTRPLLDHFLRSVERFYDVDGSGSPEEIAERACRLIRER